MNNMQGIACWKKLPTGGTTFIILLYLIFNLNILNYESLSVKHGIIFFKTFQGITRNCESCRLVIFFIQTRVDLKMVKEI